MIDSTMEAFSMIFCLFVLGLLEMMWICDRTAIAYMGEGTHCLLLNILYIGSPFGLAVTFGFSKKGNAKIVHL
jgi:hypothetical protein